MSWLVQKFASSWSNLRPEQYTITHFFKGGFPSNLQGVKTGYVCSITFYGSKAVN